MDMAGAEQLETALMFAEPVNGGPLNWRNPLHICTSTFRDVAAKEIERLEEALRRERKDRAEVDTWAWAMYHAWPKQAECSCPLRQDVQGDVT